MRELAEVDVDDGVTFDPRSIEVEDIRAEEEYPGFRVHVTATIGTAEVKAKWDVTTGGPIVPAPKRIRINRVLGEPIELLAYSPEAMIAEKAVTNIERGLSSTRWRDYVDIVRLSQSGIDTDDLLRSSRAVASYRGVTLEPIAPYVAGYAGVAQAKWAAWRRKENLGAVCEEDLDDQMALVIAIVDPLFARGPA